MNEKDKVKKIKIYMKNIEIIRFIIDRIFKYKKNLLNF